jgi:hypothetical protein
MKIGTAVMKIDCWTIFKTLDLGLIESQIKDNTNNFLRIQEIVKEDKLDMLGNLVNQITYLLNVVNDRITQILPNKLRTKRAILAPLGSLIKVISGNLDEVDAIKYNTEIQRLNNKEHVVERKISSIQNAFDKFVNVSETINLNVKNLGAKTKEIEKIIENQTLLRDTVTNINNMYQILNNFRNIYENIQEIETAIAFSKLHILHQSIINTTELYTTLKVIEQHAITIYPVTINNLMKIERSIILKSYIDKNKLVFVLEVPLVAKETYIYYKVIPIPIMKLPEILTIIPKFPYLMVNRLKYTNVASACEEIENNKFLCTNDNLAQYQHETCIEQIMLIKNNYSQCQQHKIKIEKLKVQKIQNTKWMLFSEELLIITEHCKEEAYKYNIRGTYILTSNPNCDTQVGDTFISKASNASMVIPQLAVVQVPEPQQELEKGAKQLDLRNVDFTDIKDILQSAKSSDSNLQPNSDTFIVTSRASFWTILLYIFVIIIIIVYLTFKFKERICICIRNSPKINISPSDNFSLEEGGVKSDEPLHIKFVSTSKTIT